MSKLLNFLSRCGGRLENQPWVRLAFFSLIALWLTWPMLERAAWLNEFRDAQVLDSYESAAAASVKDYGQIPLWDPYYCGGVSALGAPQSRFASPTFLFSLLLGAERALAGDRLFVAGVGNGGIFPLYAAGGGF